MSSPPEPRPFRLIALDLDGTLLNDRREISPRDAAALRQFAQSGGLVVLASGRMTANIRPFCDAMGIDGPTIGYNGALARDSLAAGAEVIVETALPARYADELLDYTRRERFHLNNYRDEQLYASDDLERFRGREPTKCILVTDPTVPGSPDPRHRDELYDLWHARWGAGVTVMRTNPEYLEFYHRDASKAAALAAVARHCGIEQALTLSFGDNYNDLSMLEWAGCGVAVANATPEVKAGVDWVSPLTNNESAVADAIDRLVIEPASA